MNSKLEAKHIPVHHIILLIVVISALLFLSLRFEIFKKRPDSHNITFIVEADGGFAMITYADNFSDVSEATNLTTPWKRTQINPSGSEILLTAGNPSGFGTIKCKLLMDNKLWKENEAAYPDDKVACGGIVH